MKVDLTFSNSFDLVSDADLPSGAGGYQRYYYPGARSDGGHADLLILVKPFGAEPWYGLFAGKAGKGRAAHGIYSCPDGRSICVVVNGSGYLVLADDPRVWSEVPVHPVLSVSTFPEQNLLVLNDFVGLVAYGPQGQLWRCSPTDVTDELVVDRVSGDTLYVRGWNYATGDIAVAIDVTTGAERSA